MNPISLLGFGLGYLLALTVAYGVLVWRAVYRVYPRTAAHSDADVHVVARTIPLFLGGMPYPIGVLVGYDGHGLRLSAPEPWQRGSGPIYLPWSEVQKVTRVRYWYTGPLVVLSLRHSPARLAFRPVILDEVPPLMELEH